MMDFITYELSGPANEALEYYEGNAPRCSQSYG